MATSSSSSSAQKTHHHLNLNHLYSVGGGPTSAPPPTPSSQQPSLSSTSDSSAAAADTLSRLLHRLPPNLSLPTRLSPRAPTPKSTAPLPSFSSLSSTSSSIFELGYFQLTHHSITPQLAESAESDSLSLFDLPLDQKLASFPRDWPLGYNYDDDSDDSHHTGSFCLDGPSLDAASTDLKLMSLRELTRELEKLGLEVVERLASTMGFENPLREGGGGGVGLKHSSMMWVTSSSSDGEQARRMYPYVVGMQYQIRPRKWTLLSDTGSVNVEPQVGSVLVTLGDIAQVWSNGKLKKVRGRPSPVSVSDDGKSSCIISMTLLLTLPLESTVSPILIDNNNNREKEEEAYKPEITTHNIQGNTDEDVHSIGLASTSNNNSSGNGNGNDNGEDDPHEAGPHQRIFNSFSFEDYAWRVYHDERQLLKDPLLRYRILD